MESIRQKTVIKALFVAWAILFFFYSLLIVWAGTGSDALAGPSTPKENLFIGLWFGLSIFQLIMAILANKRDKAWLFWVTAALVVVSLGLIVVPLVMVFDPYVDL